MPVLILLLALIAAAPVQAAPPVSFALPIDCQPSRTCWIANFVDLDSSADKRDFACGARTYDTHKGTDFALRDLTAMNRGVKIVAAAPGVVAGTRDGMRDANFKDIGGRTAVKGKECGNGVTIDHGKGWLTQYCHMKKGSVKVGKGDVVTTGQELGLVGQSGLTEFPHLHFQVSLSGKNKQGKKVRATIDPFLGINGREQGKCGVGREPLWSPETLKVLTYRPTEIYNAGFAYRTPKREELQNGLFQAKELSVLSPNMVFWAEIYGVRKGDIIVTTIKDPNGKTLSASKSKLDKSQVYTLHFAGKKRRGDPWPAGKYKGEILVLHPTSAKKGTGVRMRRSVVLK
ncbi:M23 family metallopeptidase [Magnetospira sp. QH-2]|uniref:M23 family metallopeptidase n=1 Tax=Magnetospira sp. (strain QH-2) TaxID=1288970 RepID=UPI0003E81ACC|nr:M23 family metallopeptidase [Magnetospira sp. QH-2]CCQ74870.1 putative peptidase M23 [Magnetospira sp. QH-2]